MLAPSLAPRVLDPEAMVASRFSLLPLVTTTAVGAPAQLLVGVHEAPEGERQLGPDGPQRVAHHVPVCGTKVTKDARPSLEGLKYPFSRCWSPCPGSERWP